MFPLLYIGEVPLILSVLNKMKPKAFARLNRASSAVFNFIKTHHFLVNIRVNKEISLWVSYPKTKAADPKSSAMIVDLFLSNTNKCFPLHNALSYFTGFYFSILNLYYLEIYEQSLLPIHLEEIQRFLENRVWKNTQIKLGKKLPMNLVNIVKPRQLLIESIPTEIPSYVRSLEISTFNIDNMFEIFPRFFKLEEIYMNIYWEYDQVLTIIEAVIRKWSRNQHEKMEIFQTNHISFIGEEQEKLECLLEKSARTKFKEIKAILDGWVPSHTVIEVEVKSNHQKTYGLIQYINQNFEGISGCIFIRTCTTSFAATERLGVIADLSKVRFDNEFSPHLK